MLKTLVELNDSGKISAATAELISRELAIDSAIVGDDNIDTSAKTLKELIAEITDNTNNSNIEF